MSAISPFNAVEAMQNTLNEAVDQRDQLLAALQRLLRERAAFGRPKPATWAETAAMLAGMGAAVYVVDEADE